MVDGKEFFGGDVKTGLKNLPVDMVEKLKTYDKKSDLARITGIDEVVLEETPFNLTELLDEINTVLEPQTASKNIEYEIMRKDSLPVSHLIGSPRYLSQILLNLASNAIKYGRAGGYLRLNTRLISNTEQEAVYEIPHSYRCHCPRMASV